MQDETLPRLSKLEKPKLKRANLAFDILGSSKVCSTPVLRTSGDSKLASANLALSN